MEGVELLPHHVGYAVANIHEAVKKFFDLGYENTSEIIQDENRRINIVFMKHKDADMCVELIEPLDDHSPVSATLSQKKNVASPYHICYETHSLKKSIYLLKKKGYYVTSNPAPAPAIGNRCVAFLVNRDAGLIELLEK